MKIRSSLLRVLRFSIALLLVGLAVRSLRGAWNTAEILSLLKNASIPWLVLAALILASTYVALIVSWRKAMLDQGAHLRFLQAARIVSLSNLGKYAPGRIWGIVGAGVLARDYKISAWNASAVTLVLQVLTLATGMLVAGILSADELSKLGPAAAPFSIAIGVAVLMISLCLSLPSMRQAIDSLFQRMPSRIPRIRFSTWGTVIALSLFIWFGFGASLMLMERSLFGSTSFSWMTAVGVFAAAYVLGFVAMLAPAGIGPREAAFVVLLSPVTNPLHAAALALVCRVLVTICDLAFALPFLKGAFGGPDSKSEDRRQEARASRT